LRNVFISLAIIFGSLLLLIFFPVGDNPGSSNIYITSAKANIFRDIGVGKSEPFRSERARDSIHSNAPPLGGSVDNGGYYLPYERIVSGNIRLTQLSYYVQTRGPWANTVLNHPSTNATFAYAGCGYTSMAMAISSITNDSSFTPLSLNPYLATSGNNICVTGLYSWGGLPYYFNRIGLDKEWKTIYMGEVLTVQKIKTTIDSGGFIVLSAGAAGPYTTSGHIMILNGYTVDDSGSFKEMIIQDPNVTGGISSGRFARFGSRVRVDMSDWRIYDNAFSTAGHVRYGDLRIATAHIPR
jgi:hypothetical protein